MTDDMPQDPWEAGLPDFPKEWTEANREFAMSLVRAQLDAEAIVGEDDFGRLLHALTAMDERQLRAVAFVLVTQVQILGGGSSPTDS